MLLSVKFDLARMKESDGQTSRIIRCDVRLEQRKL